MIFKDYIETPIGEMVCFATDENLLLLEFADRKELSKEVEELKDEHKSEIQEEENKLIANLKVQLSEYFRGKRQRFNIPLNPVGTDFQLKVWGELSLIPYAETRTYMEQTQSLGDEKAIRAVAAANGKNKIAILIPCHRVIGADGSLTGYAGGIDRKRYLLNLEREVAGPKDLFSQ